MLNSQLPAQDRPQIVVVSGLPRSGTSMMMAMLEAGGQPLLTDGVRKPDADNPGGYFELEATKRLGEESSWLSGAVGKAVKIVSFHLTALPATYRYAVVFMERPLNQILASQRLMLANRGEAQSEDVHQMRELYEKHLQHTKAWLAAQSNVRVLTCDFDSIIQEADRAAVRVSAFLGRQLDPRAMGRVVDPTLRHFPEK